MCKADLDSHLQFGRPVLLSSFKHHLSIQEEAEIQDLIVNQLEGIAVEKRQKSNYQ